MQPKPAKLSLALLVALGLAACDNNGSGGESGTPAENISEAEPEGVGGTTND
jgi:hypothetical protein